MDIEKIKAHFRSLALMLFTKLKIDGINKGTNTVKDIPKFAQMGYYAFITTGVLGLLCIIAGQGVTGILLVAVSGYVYGFKEVAIPELTLLINNRIRELEQPSA